MRKIWIIAVREYLATVRTKAFIIGIVMMPLLMSGGILVQIVSKRFEDRETKTYGVIDRTPGQQVFPVLQAAVRHRNEVETIDEKNGQRKAMAFDLVAIAPSADKPEAIAAQRLELSERVRLGEMVGFVEIGSEVVEFPSATESWMETGRLVWQAWAERDRSSKTPSNPTSLMTFRQIDDEIEDRSSVRFQAMPARTGMREFHSWLVLAASRAILTVRFAHTRMNPAELKALLKGTPIRLLGLTARDEESGKIADSEGIKTAVPVFVAIGLTMLQFSIIMVGASPLLSGILEEKMQRIAEVLLGAVRPFELMMGKLVGGVGVSLTLASVYLSGSYGALWYYGFAEHLPLSLILWFLFFLVLALFLYGSAFVAVGAACTDMKEPQALMMPVMVPAMLPLFVLGPVLAQPDGLLARVVSFFPPSTPMMMILRQAMASNILWWEPLAGAMGVLAMTVLVVWAAGRVLRVGMLMQGKGAKLSEMFTWIVRG